MENNLFNPYAVYQARYTQYFCEFCEQNPLENTGVGFKPTNLCIALADVLPQDHRASAVANGSLNDMCKQRELHWFKDNNNDTQHLLGAYYGCIQFIQYFPARDYVWIMRPTHNC